MFIENTYLYGDRTQPPKQNPTARDALRGENWDNGGMSGVGLYYLSEL
ncbi:MAG: hypothetical protein HWQ23_01975 [Nostoc sp. JL33]|nr:hypothetical protein [Nostoc sp. JL33]MBN3869115.1 hypothetical protein [Nostoc sp. JL33]